MQATARRLSVVSAMSCARRRLIRSVRPTPHTMSDSIEPHHLVDHHLDAFNSRDIEAIMSLYADDAQIFEFPSTLLVSGSAALRTRFTAYFQKPNLRAQHINSLVLGKTVIQMVLIHGARSDGSDYLGWAVIFECRGDRIARAWIILD
jgi:hypothetical protein